MGHWIFNAKLVCKGIGLGFSRRKTAVYSYQCLSTLHVGHAIHVLSAVGHVIHDS